MSGGTADDKVRRRDFYDGGKSANSSAPRLPETHMSQQGGYLSSQLDKPESEGYSLADLSRQNSRTPLSPPLDEAGNHQQQQQQQSPDQSRERGRSASSSPKVVHYPPTSQLATVKPEPVQQTYRSVPLNDEPSGTSTPNASGRNTPKGGRRPFSFLPMNQSEQSFDSGEKRRRPKNPRAQSWDLLGERAEWEDYKPSSAKVEQLRFAEGDVGTNRLSRFYYWALNSSIIVRWAFYIVPITAILWIPGIVGFTAAPEGNIWGTPLLWWSIWATVLWCGFWASTAVFMILPRVWSGIVGSIIPSARKYTDVIRALGKYAKLIPWLAAVWVSFTPLVIVHCQDAEGEKSRTNLSTFVAILFGLFLCSLVWGGEKLIVQLIALNFHLESYESRVVEQKASVKFLTTLYVHSHDIPGRSDTLTDADSRKTKGSQIPKMAIRKALRGIREVAQTTTTAIGNVASEMAQTSVLQTNSPANKVTAALASANKSKALARRLFYSFRAPGKADIELEDVARFFPDLETAEAAFAFFDKDNNGNATRDEVEAAVLLLHRDRLALEASMRDLDGAVRHLDGIFMVLVLLIWILIIAAMITTRLTAFVTSAGTFVLGLSWLIGTTLQEIILSCIFLFVKHPYDVGDRINIDTVGYTCVKMNLLSSNFRGLDGKYIWIGHNVLATKIIENIRRSGPISETFTVEVDFATSFEALQALRAKMLAFCKENSRDFLPVFDVVVDDIPAQGKMILKADIKYVSNWQQGALKVQRRNKWVCALKMTMGELKIYGPGGAGDPAPAPADPIQYTLVPYEQIAAATPESPVKSESPPPTFQAATKIGAGLMDRHAALHDTSNDIWGDADELRDNGYPSRPGTPGMSTGLNTPIDTARLNFGPSGFSNDPYNTTSTSGSRVDPSAYGSAHAHAHPQPVPAARLEQQQPSVGPAVGPARTRLPHGQGPENIEMTSAPVARRQI